MSRSVHLDKITDGMVLSEPIINNYGQTLIPAGTSLSEKHIKILRTWNIFSVTVKGDNSEQEMEISDEMKEIANEALKKRFLWEPRNSHEVELFNIGILNTAKKLFSKPAQR